MIDTSLNKKYVAQEAPNFDFSPVPDGDYEVVVKEISPWKEVTKSISVNVLDEKGKPTKDETGKNITVPYPNCKFYKCDVKLEITSGEYAGRIIFHQLTTHPNISWSIPAFLNGVGLQELSANEIQAYCVNKKMIVTTTINTYEKEVQDKKTGLMEIQTRQNNKVKTIKPLDTNTESVVTVNNVNINDIV